MSSLLIVRGGPPMGRGGCTKAQAANVMANIVI